MSGLRYLFVWPVLLAELVFNLLRHTLRWIRVTENQIHVINFLVIGASTFFLFGTIRMFMPNMPESIRLMITVIIGGLEYMALEYVAKVLRTSERSGLLSLDLKRLDRRFVAMALVLIIAASLNIMGSYVDVHYRLAGDEATAAFEDHEAQDVHEAALGEAYPDLRAVQDALLAAERDYQTVATMAQRGADQQDGEWAQSFYGVNAGTGPRFEALQRVADLAAARAVSMADQRTELETTLASLQSAYADGADPVERDVLRQQAYDQIRTRYDGLPLPGPSFADEAQAALRAIHTVPAGQESQLPQLEDDAMLVLTSVALAPGPRIPERDVSMRTVIGALSGHIRYAWHDLMRGGTEAWIAAGIALVLDGSVLMLSMAWYVIFLLPYLIAILVRDTITMTVTAVARAVGTLFGRAALLPGEVAVVGATEYRQGWRHAREGWQEPDAKRHPPAEEVLEEILTHADPQRARRVIRVFAKAQFVPKVDELGGPGFVVENEALDGLHEDDALVWNALITELLVRRESALLRLRGQQGGMSYLFRPEVMSAAKRMLDALDRSEGQAGLGDSMRKALDRYREELADA